MQTCRSLSQTWKQGSCQAAARVLGSCFKRHVPYLRHCWSFSTLCCCFSVPAAPSNCSAVPTAPLSNGGSWPAGCAGMAIGASCTADCPFGGSATVTCQATGNWQGTASGTCGEWCWVWVLLETTADASCAKLLNCCQTFRHATASAQLLHPRAVPMRCLIRLPGRNQQVLVVITTALPPVVACLPTDAATNCTYTPTTSLSNGNWPDSCAGASFGATCPANCTWGGSASVDCLNTGFWSTPATGSCNGEHAATA